MGKKKIQVTNDTEVYMSKCIAGSVLLSFVQSDSSILPAELITDMQRYFRVVGCYHPDPDIRQGRCEIAARGLLLHLLPQLHQHNLRKAEDAVMTIARINGM